MSSERVNKIPIDQNGNVVWSPSRLHKEDYEWIDNHRFNAILYLEGTCRKGNTYKFIFGNLDGSKKYEVFCDDIVYMMEHMDHGVVSGAFEYVHRGGYYGITLVHPAI